MPAGVTWGVYLRFGCAALLSMMAGAQVVHSCYHPLADLDDLVKVQKEKLIGKIKSGQEGCQESLTEGPKVGT